MPLSGHCQRLIASDLGAIAVFDIYFIIHRYKKKHWLDVDIKYFCEFAF